MRRVILGTVGTIVVGFCVGALASARSDAAGTTITCFKKGEKVDGQLKICYYDCAGSEAAITVKSHQLCPLSIRRD
jgi:hypothetical protein